MKEYISKRYVALKYSDFRLYIIGQFISATGSQMQMVALNWHVYVLTHSAAALGLIGLIRFIPVLLFSMVGGAVADSFNRKKVIFVTSVLLTIFASILAFITYKNYAAPLWIYVLTIISAIVSSFEMPARQAFVPSLVKKEHLRNAISLNTIIWQTATVIGPALAGFAIAKFGIGTVYACNAFSYIAILIGLIFITSQGTNTKMNNAISIKAMIDGFKFVRSRSILWSTMLLDFFSTFFASATSLIPIFAKDILNVGPQGLGILYAAPSVGAVAAAFLMAHKGEVRKQGIVLLAGVAIYAIGTTIFGFSTQFFVSCIALMLVGGGDSISMILRQTVRQLETNDEMRGRMSAINMMFAMGGPQLGEFESGLLASAIGAPLSVVVGGIGTLIVVFLVAAYVPRLRNYTGPNESLEKELLSP